MAKQALLTLMKVKLHRPDAARSPARGAALRHLGLVG
jgi:hypothetical protein